MTNDIVTLIVMTENNDSRAESFAGGFDLRRQLFVGHDEKIFDGPDLFEYGRHQENHCAFASGNQTAETRETRRRRKIGTRFI